jgi:hypothetical protein
MIFVSFVLALLSVNAANSQVMSTFVREQAGTLPRGRFLVSMVSAQSSIDRMYNGAWGKEPLSENFNQNITFGKITREEPVRGNQLSGLFLSNGVSLADSAGEVSGTVSGTVSAKVPLLGYGISDDLGVYFALPIIEFKMNAHYQFKKSPQAETFLKQLKDSDQSSVAEEFNVALNTSLENKLNSANYDWNSTLNKTYVGDFQINVVKVLVNSSDFKSQIQPYLILPTSNDQDLRDLYGLRAGDQRWGVGAKFATQKQFFGLLQFNAALSSTFLFPTEQGRRLPKDESDQLNEYLDPSVAVGGGMSYRSQIQIRYAFPKWVGLSLGCDWQQRFQDTFSGRVYDSSVYKNGEAKTGSSLLSTYASIDLNSIQSFLSGGFLFPAVAELGVGLPLAGQNAIAEPVIQLQGTMFF